MNAALNSHRGRPGDHEAAHSDSDSDDDENKQQTEEGPNVIVTVPEESKEEEK